AGEQDVGGDEEVALLAAVAIEGMAADDVLALRLAVARDRQRLEAVLLAPLEEFRAGQQRVAEDVDVREHGHQVVEVPLEVGEVVARQAPDELRRDRDAFGGERARDRFVVVGAHVRAVRQLERQRRQGLEGEVVVPEEPVAVQQPDDVLHALVVVLRPGGREGVRTAGALLQVDDDLGLGAVLAQRAEVRVAEPDVVDAAVDEALEVVLDAVERELEHLRADRAGAPLAEAAAIRAAAAGLVGDLPVPRLPARVAQLDDVERGRKAIELAGAGARRRAVHGAALVDEREARDAAPRRAPFAVEELDEGLLALAEDDDVDAVAVQEVLRALDVRSARADEQLRHVVLHGARDLEELGDVPGVAA